MRPHYAQAASKPGKQRGDARGLDPPAKIGVDVGVADDPPAVDHLPGESSSGLFGGNSNRRGRVRMPTNDTRVQALEKFHRYLGNGFAVEVPCAGGERLPLTVPGLRS